MPTTIISYYRHMCVLLLYMLVLFVSAGPLRAGDLDSPPISHTSIAAYHRSLPRINNILGLKRLDLGSAVFIRVFKQENELELWIQDKHEYKLYKTYIICFNSGTLGPKLKEGDRQSPEGFYHVSPDQMNPWSDFHLSFNLGYPNEYDQAYNRSGSALMVHGRCSSDGCFAMTDYYMDEIYTLVHAALEQSQVRFQVHIFPFRLNEENMKNHQNSSWYPFWTNLKKGYEFFEYYHIPPLITVENGHYVVSHPLDNKQLAKELESSIYDRNSRL
jgi:murein L,D-transpeptidase YafK